MEKIIQVIKATLITVIVLLFLGDLLTFCIAKHRMPQEMQEGIKFRYFVINPWVYMEDTSGFFFDTTGEEEAGRFPDGLEYKDKTPIAVFGDSVANGLFLKTTETLGYKLAHAVKRPVFNRSIPGGGLQHMLIQAESDSFYKEVPPTDLIIYLFTDFNYRLLLGVTWNITDQFLYPYFRYKNGKLEYADTKNPFLNYFRSSFFIRYLAMKYYKDIFRTNKKEEFMTDFVVAHITETQKVIANNKIYKEKNITPKMVVILYENIFCAKIHYRETLKKKLKSKGILVIDTNEIKGIEYNKNYFADKTNHPSEKVWDLIVPFVVKKLESEKLLK